MYYDEDYYKKCIENNIVPVNEDETGTYDIPKIQKQTHTKKEDKFIILKQTKPKKLKFRYTYFARPQPQKLLMGRGILPIQSGFWLKTSKGQVHLEQDTCGSLVADVAIICIPNKYN